MPLVSRTRATLRSAEFGFLGVCVNTRTHTPRFWGLLWRAGLFVLVSTFSRPLRTNWLIVGIRVSLYKQTSTATPATPWRVDQRPWPESPKARHQTQSPIAANSVATGGLRHGRCGGRA